MDAKQRLIADLVVYHMENPDHARALYVSVQNSEWSPREKLEYVIAEMFSDRPKKIAKIMAYSADISDDDISELFKANLEIDAESDATEVRLTIEDVIAMTKAGQRAYESTKLLTGSRERLLPVSLEQKLGITQVDPWDAIVIAKLYGITQKEADEKICEIIPGLGRGEDVPTDRVRAVIDDLVWAKCTVDNGFYILRDEEDDDSERISYFDAFKIRGHSDADARREAIMHCYKTVQRRFDAPHAVLEFDIGGSEAHNHESALKQLSADKIYKIDIVDEIEEDDGTVTRTVRKETRIDFSDRVSHIRENGAEIELKAVGDVLVPARMVKLKYARNTDSILRLESNASKYVEYRQYAPFTAERCLAVLDELGKKDLSGASSVTALEHQCNVSFYSFKLSEAYFYERFPRGIGNVRTNFNEWSNAITTADDYSSKYAEFNNPGYYYTTMEITLPDGSTSRGLCDGSENGIYKYMIGDVHRRYFMFKSYELALQELKIKEESGAEVC